MEIAPERLFDTWQIPTQDKGSKYLKLSYLLKKPYLGVENSSEVPTNLNTNLKVGQERLTFS